MSPSLVTESRRKHTNSHLVPPTLHHRCGRRRGGANLRGLKSTEGFFDCLSRFRGIQVGDPEIAHRRLDVFVTQQILDSSESSLCLRTVSRTFAGMCASLRGMYRPARFANSLHDAKAGAHPGSLHHLGKISLQSGFCLWRSAIAAIRSCGIGMRLICQCLGCHFRCGCPRCLRSQPFTSLYSACAASPSRTPLFRK